MKDFRKHMANEHPCILEKFDSIDKELKGLDNSWMGTTSLLGLTANNVEVDVTNNENVTKESYFKLINCKEIYLKVIISEHTFNNNLYNRLFKSDIESGGMGENTVYFRSVPMKQGDGKLHTLVLRFFNNYAGTIRKIKVYDEIFDPNPAVMILGDTQSGKYNLNTMDFTNGATISDIEILSHFNRRKDIEIRINSNSYSLGSINLLKGVYLFRFSDKSNTQSGLVTKYVCDTYYMLLNSSNVLRFGQ